MQIISDLDTVMLMFRPSNGRIIRETAVREREFYQYARVHDIPVATFEAMLHQAEADAYVETDKANVMRMTDKGYRRRLTLPY